MFTEPGLICLQYAVAHQVTLEILPQDVDAMTPVSQYLLVCEFNNSK